MFKCQLLKSQYLYLDHGEVNEERVIRKPVYLFMHFYVRSVRRTARLKINCDFFLPLQLTYPELAWVRISLTPILFVLLRI